MSFATAAPEAVARMASAHASLLSPLNGTIAARRHNAFRRFEVARYPRCRFGHTEFLFLTAVHLSVGHLSSRKDRCGVLLVLPKQLEPLSLIAQSAKTISRALNSSASDAAAGRGVLTRPPFDTAHRRRVILLQRSRDNGLTRPQ
jgi:hypothetical protein